MFCLFLLAVPGGTTVLVELTPDIHICGLCRQQFNNLDAFVAHKRSGCQLSSATAEATSTVQFVSEETVPAAQTQTTTRTITSETQTITGIYLSGKTKYCFILHQGGVGPPRHTHLTRLLTRQCAKKSEDGGIFSALQVCFVFN